MSGGQTHFVNRLFGHWSFRQQLEAIHSADVIIGAHGAGLAHLQFARPKTVIVELQKPGRSLWS